MAKRSLASIVKEIAEKKTKKEKVAAIQALRIPALDTVFAYTYTPTVEWLLPDGAPPYKPFEGHDQEGRFYTEIRKLYLFVKGGNDELTKVRREHLFIQMLEAIDKDDAKLLIQMKDRKLQGITKEVIKDAIPECPW
jgi:hypothetical protein